MAATLHIIRNNLKREALIVLFFGDYLWVFGAKQFSGGIFGTLEEHFRPFSNIYHVYIAVDHPDDPSGYRPELAL